MKREKTTLIFRGIAFMIDLMMSALIALIIGFLINGGFSLDNVTMCTLIGGIFMISRDTLGKSLGKYFLGLSIISAEENKKTKFYQRWLRNITSPIYIVDILFVLISRRHMKLGDFLAKTNVVLDEDSCVLKRFIK